MPPFALIIMCIGLVVLLLIVGCNARGGEHDGAIFNHVVVSQRIHIIVVVVIVVGSIASLCGAWLKHFHH